MHLDTTITLGNVLTIASSVIGMFLGYTKLRERLVAIETQLGPLWGEYNDRRQMVRRAADREQVAV